VVLGGGSCDRLDRTLRSTKPLRSFRVQYRHRAHNSTSATSSFVSHFPLSHFSLTLAQPQQPLGLHPRSAARFTVPARHHSDRQYVRPTVIIAKRLFVPQRLPLQLAVLVLRGSHHNLGLDFGSTFNSTSCHPAIVRVRLTHQAPTYEQAQLAYARHARQPVRRPRGLSPIIRALTPPTMFDIPTRSHANARRHPRERRLYIQARILKVHETARPYLIQTSRMPLACENGLAHPKFTSEETEFNHLQTELTVRAQALRLRLLHV
jgi:hypothetical protein